MVHESWSRGLEDLFVWRCGERPRLHVFKLKSFMKVSLVFFKGMDDLSLNPVGFNYDFHHWHVPAMSVDPHLVDGLSQILRSFVLNPIQSPIISWVFLKGQSISHKQFRSVTNCSAGSVFACRLLCCEILIAESSMCWASLCPHQWYSSMYWRYVVPFYNTISINNNTFRRLSLVASEPIKNDGSTLSS